jgi:predicted helicase
VKWYKRFTVVIGNPPYTNYGQLNKIPFILELLQDFKRGLGEKKLNLDDDFIKFIRFGQFAIQQSGVGVFGMVTNSTFLDGITHRRMREYLLESFNCGAVLDLHGSATKKETCPDGSKDENVFEIKQGVAVSILARTPEAARRSLHFGELWGLQDTKYQRLESTTRLSQTEIVVAAPNYFFVPKSVENAEEYERGISVKDAFCESGPGIKTERDNVGIQQTRSDMEAVIADFKTMPVEALRTKYELGEDSRDWKVINAKADVRENDNADRIRPVQYRPFDFQWTWYSGKTRGFIGTPGFRIGSHMSKGPNLGFVTSRTVYGPDSWRDALVTNTICEFGIMATRPGNTAPVFPLYLYEETLAFDVGHKSIGAAQGLSKRPNFTPTFLKAIASALQLPQKGEHGLPAGLTPEDIFHYAYAVFHSPGYRSRYAEFLKIDFPRLPLTGNLELFRALARLGGELTALHLLESPKLAQPITEFIGGRHPEVEKISWSRNTVWVDKAQTTGFQGVRADVWNFHIGGYQVCEKWLKDRKGRTLTKDDLAHYQKIVVALSETIRLMAEIDEVIEQHGGWPLK